MRIAIVGAGGVGGLVGALLARAGEEVLVLARGGHADAIRRDGLRVESPLGSFRQPVSAVSDDPAALGAADAVLVAVKAWQVEELAPRLAPLVGAGGFAVPLQNGVESADRLAAALGPDRVIGGLAHVFAWIEAPGFVRHAGKPPRITVGERGAAGTPPSARVTALGAALRRAGVEVVLSEDIERAAWEKFLIIDPWGTVAAAARAPVGVLRTVPETRALLVGAMEELARIGRARGVALPPDAVARAMDFLDGALPEATASMQRDLGSGRPSELDDQTGSVLRLARAAGLPAPVHEALYAALLPQDLAARGRIPAFPRS